MTTTAADKKNAGLEWTTECQTALDTLKKALVSPHVMSYYDPTKPTIVIVDASKYGLTRMLTQFDSKTRQHKVVRQDSRSTTAPESRYAQIELEGAAVKFAIRNSHIPIWTS